MNRKRFNLDYCINFIKGFTADGKPNISERPFEIVIKRNSIYKHKIDRMYLIMTDVLCCKEVYRYESAGKYFVEIRTYSRNFNRAKYIRDTFIRKLKEVEHGEN